MSSSDGGWWSVERTAVTSSGPQGTVIPDSPPPDLLAVHFLPKLICKYVTGRCKNFLRENRKLSKEIVWRCTTKLLKGPLYMGKSFSLHFQQ